MLQVSEINAVGKGGLEINEMSFRGILFVISGSGNLLLSGKQLEICRGRVLFLEVDDVVVLEIGAAIRGFLVCFEDLFFDDFLVHYPRYRDCGVFVSVRFLDVFPCDVLAIKEELSWLKAEISSPFPLMRLKLRFNLVLLVVLGGLDLSKGHEDKLYRDFMSLLESSFRIHRTSGFYADSLGITMRRLNRLCRSWFDGKGFTVVHRERLLCEAEYLLLETEKSVKEIAFELEFCSQQHFRGYFFRAKGMSPSTFRQRLGMKYTV